MQNLKLKKENSELERITAQKVALYDITKDICKSLDEAEVLDIFKERMHNYINIKDCVFLGPEENISAYPAHAVLPLKINKNLIGYLAAGFIAESDKEKFHILANQLLIGIKRARLYKEVQDLAVTDTLTGLYTRRYFSEKLKEEMERSKEFKLKFSFLMIDVDNFKALNDNYGHLVGDAILRETAKVIKANTRQVDFIGRYGGEEIAGVLAETGRDEALLVAERIRKALDSKEIRAYDEEIRVTVSIGIAVYADVIEPDKLIDKADSALYEAKLAGRNRVILH